MSNSASNVTKMDMYTAIVFQELEATAVLGEGVFNRDYEGDAKTGSVKIPVTQAIDIKDYSADAGCSYDYQETTYKNILVNDDKAINEIIDGHQATQVPQNVINDRLTKAGRGIANYIDNDGLSTLITDGTAYTITAAITADNAYDTIVDMFEKQSEANVPLDGRVLIVSSKMMALLKKSDEFKGDMGLSDELKKQGYVGKLAGYLIKEKNSTTDYLAVATHPYCATEIVQFIEKMDVKDLADGKHIGACVLQGRFNCTHEVTNEDGVLVLKQFVQA